MKYEHTRQFASLAPDNGTMANADLTSAAKGYECRTTALADLLIGVPVTPSRARANQKFAKLDGAAY